jgi:hypothetical protein
VRAWSALYYIGCVLVLLALVTKFQKSFLPGGIATQIGHNSESFALALAVGATIQFARPWWMRDGGRRTAWAPVVAVAAVWILLALGVYYLGLPASIKTLNEPLAAAGLLTLYFGVPRPWKLSWIPPVLVVVVVAVAMHVQFISAQAETVTSFVLVAITVDQIQRSTLRSTARDSSSAWLWWLFLAVWPALMQLLNRHDVVGGWIGDLINYQARGAEGFWGALLICLYFAGRSHLQNRTAPGDTTEERLAAKRA